MELPKQEEEKILSETELDPVSKEEGMAIRRKLEEEKCKYGHSFLEAGTYCLNCGISSITTTNTPPITTKAGWETRFDNNYSELIVSNVPYAVIHEDIKSFIKQVEQDTEKRVVGEIEKCFDEFLLMDWSGEAEVYSEIERLKETIKTNLKSKYE